MSVLLLAMAQEPDGGAGGAVAALIGGVGGLIGLAVALLMIVSMWKIFTKAGEPGWASIIPIYNLVVLLKIINKPLWWILLFLLPCVNFVAFILVALELAKCFGKSVGFAIGMMLVPFICYPMLAFGDARYQRPA